jgi:hypothetical protein
MVTRPPATPAASDSSLRAARRALACCRGIGQAIAGSLTAADRTAGVAILLVRAARMLVSLSGGFTRNGGLIVLATTRSGDDGQGGGSETDRYALLL